MRHCENSVSPSRRVLLFAIFTLFATVSFAAPSANTLYTFTGFPDGSWPKAGVVLGPDGALYGATQYGGSNDFGTIYKVVHNSDGTWTESVIYSFTDVNDGAGPIGPITFDAAGNIYGTTAFGKPYEQGTVFKLTQNAGVWSATLLYAFTGGADGQQPLTGITLDESGNFYGTTPTGGTGSGVLYKLSPNADGSWTQSVIHAFGAFQGDGYMPSTGVLLDAAGNLYGATSSGTIYEFSPNSDGSWTENILYAFSGKADGAIPNALVFDKAGSLYGSAGGGGQKVSGCPSGTCGTIFRLAHSGGSWVFKRKEPSTWECPGSFCL
jgi:uncharacterized repeat protein (TIGR03803 family)